MKTITKQKTSFLTGLMMFTSMVNSTTLLSNIDSPESGGFGGNPDSANIIETGSSPLIIGQITISWESINTPSGLNQIAIYEDESGIPGTTQVGTFFTNPNNTALGEMTYQGLALLDENSVYWVVIDIIDDAEASYTFSNVVYSDSSTGGATIPSDVAAAYGNNETGSWILDGASNPSASLRIELGSDIIYQDGFENTLINEI